MIESLHISNYALISSIDLTFCGSLNIITGETGAGKSIILGALGLVMGGRADLTAVRDAGRKTVVEAVFGLDNLPAVNKAIAAAGLDTDPGHVILRRELTAKGGSRAFVNDTPVTLPLMRQIALMLLDIHTQHQNLLLTDHDFQLSALDAMAGTAPLLAEYTVAYRRYRAALADYRRTSEMLKRGKADREYFAFQLEQLDNLGLKDEDEQERLEEERDMLTRADDIKRALRDITESLSQPLSVDDMLARAIESANRVDDVFPVAGDVATRLRDVSLELRDIVDTVGSLQHRVEADPGRLEAVDDRLDAIYSLESRHRVQSVAELIKIREDIRARLDTVANGEEALTQLEDAAKKAKKNAVILARRLSEARNAEAPRFAAQLLESARPLGMENLRCEISLSPGKLTETGLDTVEFRFAFNKNQPLMPVGKTASGGELARVMLALKAVVARRMHLPTLIFDEVDTGVSGDIASRMGAMMRDMAANAQLITITHVPAVAACGQRHIKVYKHDDDTSTMTDIRILGDDERVDELAVMLSGKARDEASRAAARALLADAVPR